MYTFPGSPRLVKGAIVVYDDKNKPTSIIRFQFNPDTLSRSLQAQTSGEGGAQADVLRLKGPPIETIKLEAEIDATDQLEVGDRSAVNMGVYPLLSALELLIYPDSGLVQDNEALLEKGSIEIIPPEAPLTLFIWGSNRVVPVRLTGFDITEEAYDMNLNPIRAKVSLSLRVLSYNDLSKTHPGYYIFKTHHKNKETMAKNGRSSASDPIISNIKFN
ncbi:MAG TPA: hypothetical protein VN414_12670 [Methanosarcina sp.]|nr:hypothetical protein [Methanosarcina sp.]